MRALVRAARPRPRLEHAWDDPAWAQAETLEIGHFRPESGPHRPPTRARLLHTDDGLLGIFRVEDRYVRSIHTRFGDPVHEDSCVEIFLQPRPQHGYINFEWNAGGTLSASYITDHRRVPGGFAAFSPLGAEEARLVQVRSSLPRTLDPEVEAPLAWQLAFFIPRELFERRVGELGALAGQEWRGNLFKCGDRTSHPHWASWAPVDALNFHLPHCFGALRFEA